MDTGLLIICHSESLHPFLFDLVVDHVSFFQFAGDVLHRDAGLHHQHQHMVCQIADLVDRLGLVFLFARDDDLSTLFAHLLEDLFFALLEEIGGVAALFGAGLAALDEVIQPLPAELLQLRGNIYFVEKAALGTGVARGRS